MEYIRKLFILNLYSDCRTADLMTSYYRDSLLDICGRQWQMYIRPENDPDKRTHTNDIYHTFFIYIYT